MRVLEHPEPFFRRFLFIVFNGGAARKAYALHLFSREWCLGCISWALLSGIVLFQITATISLPEWFMIPMVILAVFTGGCWVAFPVFVYLVNTSDQILEKQIKPGRCIRYLIGCSLWRQAAQGKLSFQFLVALLLEIGFVWIAGHWPIHSSWRVLFDLTFLINTLFYVIFPLLLFLEHGIHRGMGKVLFHKTHPASLSQTP